MNISLGMLLLYIFVSFIAGGGVVTAIYILALSIQPPKPPSRADLAIRENSRIRGDEPSQRKHRNNVLQMVRV